MPELDHDLKLKDYNYGKCQDFGIGLRITGKMSKKMWGIHTTFKNRNPIFQFSGNRLKLVSRFLSRMVNWEI